MICILNKTRKSKFETDFLSGLDNLIRKPGDFRYYSVLAHDGEVYSRKRLNAISG